MSHPFGQIRFRGFDHEMIMIPHQAVSVAAPAKPRNNFTQDIQESCAILIVVKDRFLAIASGSYMIECTGILDAQRTDHDFTLQQACEVMQR
jgi:hypothetical protein